MQFSLASIVLGLAAFASAMPQNNQGRPVPNGQCCVANTSVKQDACRINGQLGRCVPGGNNCGGRLSCIAQSNLTCNNVRERNSNLCRARAPGGGLFDGARIIQNLSQASVN